MSKKIAVLPGDGIGIEIVAQAVKILDCLNNDYNLNIEMEHGLVGGSAYDETGSPLPEATLKLAEEFCTPGKRTSWFTL